MSCFTIIRTTQRGITCRIETRARREGGELGRNVAGVFASLPLTANIPVYKYDKKKEGQV